jgi:hypothetical protein
MRLSPTPGHAEIAPRSHPRGTRRLHPRRSARCRLAVEGLEGRQLLTTIVALTEQNQLLRFDAASPTAILGTTPIGGLRAGETVLAIDLRPATGELYGLSRLGDGTGQLLVINPLTGTATLRATLAADPTDPTAPFTGLVGMQFGIDFNPVSDRLRVVSEADVNLRIDPDNGLVSTDMPLAFAAGDANVGRDPSVVDVAYTNDVAPNSPGTGTATLFGLDANLFSPKTLTDGTADRALTLVRQGGVDVPPGTPSPNTGQLFSIGAFGRTGVTAAGFDVAPSGTAFVGVDGRFDPTAVGAAVRRTFLVTIDPASGADTSRGTIGDGTTVIRDLAVVPSVQFGAPRYAIGEDGGVATITVTRTEGSIGTVTVPFATTGDTATAGSDFTATSGTLSFAPGETSKTFTVPIFNDADGEGDESLVLVLGDPTGGAFPGGPVAAQLRINANDRRDRTGPTVTRVLETGPSRGITGAVVHFDEDLDPARAQDLSNYSIVGIGPRNRRTRIDLASAAYDPVGRTVTLTAVAPFRQTRFRRLEFRVGGRRRSGITDLAGNLLDGNGDRRPGGDALLRFELFSGPNVTFTDRDGDVATIGIANGGSLDGIRPLRAPRAQNVQFWILDPIALRSTLSGTVRTRGDGLVVIAEIIGLDAELPVLLTNTSFRVNTQTFTSNATGIG